MHTILIVIHLLIVLALVGIVLVQKSEGGGLGIGGGSGFMTARGAANTLTRTTGILAAAFFATSLALGILARYGSGPTDILNRIPTNQTTTSGKNNGTLLDKLNESSPKTSSGSAGTTQANGAAQPPSAPEGTAPAAGQPKTGAQAPTSGQTTAPSGGQNGGTGSQIPTGQ